MSRRGRQQRVPPRIEHLQQTPEKPKVSRLGGTESGTVCGEIVGASEMDNVLEPGVDGTKSAHSTIIASCLVHAEWHTEVKGSNPD